jgi:nucleotide-binding universal stress UspA family protein
MFHRILVPMDFSAPSDAALDYARAVAAQFGATLQLLHVADDPASALYSTDVFVPEIERLRDEIVSGAHARLEARLTASDVSDLGATVAVVIGTPAGCIVEYAAGHGIDLIVMGTHGRGGVSYLLMGSVAERVVRTAACPVLTVHGGRKPAARAA